MDLVVVSWGETEWVLLRVRNTFAKCLTGGRRPLAGLVTGPASPSQHGGRSFLTWLACVPCWLPARIAVLAVAEHAAPASALLAMRSTECHQDHL
ncbi:hypothetical protein GUJ93_ZPchr0009g127 [Zizania palustris]|nr:hypothetical protein GUJ93_ZPchr0009g127 [Zizania palustris]